MVLPHRPKLTGKVHNQTNLPPITKNMNLAENKFGTGASVGRADLRDFELKAGAKLFDWVKGFSVEDKLGFKLPIKDQNGSGSCGGQAFSYYGEVLEALSGF